jgi:L-iditol 2-dehydrogenase
VAGTAGPDPERRTYEEFVLAAPRTIRCKARPRRGLAEHWVRIRFLYSGLCGSDLSMFEGKRQLDYPRSLGHEFLALVEEIGPNVSNVASGALVTSDLNYRCGRCEFCLGRRSHLCRQRDVQLFSNRAFAAQADIHVRYLVPLSTAAAPQLALAEPLSCVLHAKEWAAPAPGESILLVGAGGLGLCFAFSLVVAGLRFDVTDVIEARLAALESVVHPVGKATRKPTEAYDLVFDVSGTESGMMLACDRVKPGGRLCSMSHLDGPGSAPLLLNKLTRRDVAFKMSYLNGEQENLSEAGALLGARWSHAWASLVEIVPIKRIQAAFETRPVSRANKTIFAIAEDVQL